MKTLRFAVCAVTAALAVSLAFVPIPTSRKATLNEFDDYIGQYKDQSEPALVFSFFRDAERFFC